MEKYITGFIFDEEGSFSIEVAIIVAILVGCAIVFRKRLSDVWKAVDEKNQKIISKLKE